MSRIGLLLVAMLALAGCGGEDTAAPAHLEVQGAWSRPTPPGAANGVVYARFTTDVDDSLVGATVPPDVAATASLHASMTDDAAAGAHSHGGGGSGDSAMQTMTPVASFAVRRGTTLALAPGGNHVMLEGLARPLATGQPFTIRFVFESGRTLDTTVEVTTNPPS